jgi:hypothetical protein
MRLLSKTSRVSAGVIGTLTLCWAATWLVRGYYLGGALIAAGRYAAFPWERSRHLVTFGQLGVGGVVTERIAYLLWSAFVFAGIVALVASGGLAT